MALIADDQPYTFLFSRMFIVLYHPRFENITLYKMTRNLTDVLEWWVKDDNVLRPTPDTVVKEKDE